MRHISGAVFTFIAALSAALLVAICVMWVRGRTWVDTFEGGRVSADYRSASYTTIISGSGSLVLRRTEAKPPGGGGTLDVRGARPDWSWLTTRGKMMAGRRSRLVQRLGFDVEPIRDIPENGILLSGVQVVLPHWAMAGALAVLPTAWWLIRRRRWLVERRLAAGHCIQCGYDLRETSGRCPECGAAAEPIS